MNDQVTEDPQTVLDRLERRSVRQETPCGDGVMSGATWNDTGQADAPVVVLFHGGAGSWRHWVRTIPVLSQQYACWRRTSGIRRIRLPAERRRCQRGSGDRCRGLDAVIGADTGYDVAGFSFGGMMACCVAAIHGRRVRSVTIVGSSGVGPLGSAVQLLKVRHLEGQERAETHRTNLNRLMIADPAKIDALALAIQDWNTVRSRLNSGAVAQRRPAACAGPCARAAEWYLGRVRRAGQSTRAGTRRRAEGTPAGCGHPPDSRCAAIGWRTKPPIRSTPCCWKC